MAERGAELEQDDPTLEEPQDDALEQEQDPPQDDAEGDPDPDDQSGADPDPEPAPQRGRPSARDRVQSALRERDAERQRALRAEQERDQARADALQRQQLDAEAREREDDERTMAGLDENGRVQYLLAKQVKKNETTQQQILRRLDDANDKAEFSGKAARDPRRAKLMDEVETIVQRNPGLKREHVYWTLLGQRMDAGKWEEPVRRQRQQAQERVQSQRAPGNGAARSDTRPRGGARAGTIVSRMERDDPAI